MIRMRAIVIMYFIMQAERRGEGRNFIATDSWINHWTIGNKFRNFNRN